MIVELELWIATELVGRRASVNVCNGQMASLFLESRECFLKI
jgi:hypothetical protein